MSIRSRVVDRAHRLIARRLRSRYQGIRVHAERGMFNHKCHLNCAEYLRANPGRDLAIVEVIYLEPGSQPILHYVVLDRADGRHLEVTLGGQLDDAEVYRIREVDPRDHRRMDSELARSIDDWTEEFTPAWARLLLGIDRTV